MGDNESDDKQVMVGDSEWTFIIGDSESENTGMLIGVSERVVVMTETGGEGESRPDDNCASSDHRVWESENGGGDAGSAQRIWESEDVGDEVWRDWESEDDDDDDELNRSQYSQLGLWLCWCYLSHYSFQKTLMKHLVDMWCIDPYYNCKMINNGQICSCM